MTPADIKIRIANLNGLATMNDNYVCLCMDTFNKRGRASAWCKAQQHASVAAKQRAWAAKFEEQLASPV